MGLREVQKELKAMEKIEIIKMVSDIYKKIPMAKNYLDIFANDDISDLVEKNKIEIEYFVYPNDRNGRLRELEARKLIRTLRKLKIPRLSIELELHYVNCCLEVIEDFGFSDENYYNAIDKMFYSATNCIYKNGLERKYRQLVTNLVSRSYACGLDFEY